MARTYQAHFVLGAKVQNTVGKSFGVIQKNMAGIQSQAARSQRSLSGMNSALKTLLKVGAGYLSFRAIANFAKESVEAAQTQIQNQTKLTEVMHAMMGATDDQVQSVIRLAKEQEKLGVVSSEVQIAGAQQMATYLKQKKSLDTLLPAMSDLLVQQKGIKGTESDMINIANMFGKAFIGQVGLLRRAGISFTAAEERVLKYGDELTKAAMLAKVIENNVGKMNAAMLETDPGKIQQAENRLRAMRAEIGRKIIPLQAKWAETQLKLLPAVEKLIPLLDKLPPIVDAIIQKGEAIFANWDKIAPVIEFVTVALAANKVATLALVAAQKAGLVISALSKAWSTGAAALALLREGNSLAAVAQAVFNGTLLACPATWIVAGIMALVMAGYYLIKNWSKVSAFFKGLWNGPLNSGKVQTVLAVFLPFIGIPVAIIKNWDKIKTFFAGLWEGPLNNKYIQAALFAFMPLIGIPITIIKNWDKIKTFFAGLWEKLGPIFEKIGGFFGKIFGGGISVEEEGGKKPKPPRRKGGVIEVPQYARGTQYHPGGPAIINERGAELVNLPRGSQVTPHSRTQSLVRELEGGGSSVGGQSIQVSYSPHIVIQGDASREEIEQATKAAHDDFERRFRAMMGENRRLSFAR